MGGWKKYDIESSMSALVCRQHRIGGMEMRYSIRKYTLLLR
jgi:hypothetical protein